MIDFSETLMDSAADREIAKQQAMEAELTELRKDRERLDGYFNLIGSTGLEQPVWYNDLENMRDGVGWYFWLGPRAEKRNPEGPFDTFRAAIDAAMGADK